MRAQQRSRATRQLGVSVALVAFAAGSFTSTVVDAEPQSVVQAEAVQEVVAPVTSEARDLEITTVTEEIVLAHDSVEREDAGSLKGSSRVVTQGSDGTALVSYTVTYEDGEEVERVEAMKVVVDEPVDEVISVGTMAIPATSNSGANRQLGREMAAARGWTGEQWECLNALWTKESNWRHNASNPSSGAHGIPQSLPGSKMASHGADWATNPATQISWGLSYISGRYGTPCAAWSHSTARGWY